jgi:hypothetical protein
LSQKNWWARNGPSGIGLRPCNAGRKAKNFGSNTLPWEVHLIPNPILKVLSSIRAHDVRALLMGGQACVFYGAAEFSRDADFAILAQPANLARLRKALTSLQAEPIAVPPFHLNYLRRGHAVHFRCQHPDAFRMRLDVMSRMRGVDPFHKLWKRRTVIELPGGTLCPLLSLPDLVQAKKTQRDKDWPMIRRLVEAHYFQNRGGPINPDLVRFWLRELRTPELLVEVARANAVPCRKMAVRRPLLRDALAGKTGMVERLLQKEEMAERQRDKQYWLPLRKELEKLRHRRPE